MIKIDDKQIKQYEQDLKQFASRAYPYATRDTINKAAFKAQGIARDNVRNDMINRNKFTVQSIQVDKAKSLNVDNQAAIVGSTADYMETQEFGGTETSNGKGVAIATGYSAGQEGQQPRTRLPRRPNKMASIQLQKQRKAGKTQAQRNLITVKQAATSGSKFVYMDLGRRRGIFKVLGGKRKPRVKMVHDLTKPRVVIPKNPWLYPAVKETQDMIPALYKEALEYQIKRNEIFK